MRISIFIVLFFLGCCKGKAQVIFKTILPQQSITKGESFQVQYIIEGKAKVNNFKAPLFKGFRVVAGPSIYNGSLTVSAGVKPIQNIVFTLEAQQSGKFIIPGATVVVNGKLIRSNNVVIDIITPEHAFKRLKKQIDKSEYFLKPGENVSEKIKQNLFLKLIVNKKSCYVGEPVLATFKLYSRLESKSDIVKNPGFYGFSVYDMINLADKLVTEENIEGKQIDVHTIRKVQLFPLQSGTFTIDPIEIKNKVEFSRSTVFRKTEQEIVEGILGRENESSRNEHTEVFETDMSTAPVTITVKPLPENKPASFTGAVGNFTLSTSLSAESFNHNKEGYLDLTIYGKGNFIQVTPPSIKWPAGIESFEPVIADSLNRSSFPVTGSRTFHYPFIASKSGTYVIPAVEFSFFNPDTNQYHIVSAKEKNIVINNDTESFPVLPFPQIIHARKGLSDWLLLLLVCTGTSALVLLFWRGPAQKKRTGPSHVKVETQNPVFSIEELLLPAGVFEKADDKNFYTSLYNAIWTFMAVHLKLAGSHMNKENLVNRLRHKKISEEIISGIQDVLTECEKGQFTTASLTGNKKILLEETRKLLTSAEAELF